MSCYGRCCRCKGTSVVDEEVWAALTVVRPNNLVSCSVLSRKSSGLFRRCQGRTISMLSALQLVSVRELSPECCYPISVLSG